MIRNDDLDNTRYIELDNGDLNSIRIAITATLHGSCCGRAAGGWRVSFPATFLLLPAARPAAVSCARHSLRFLYLTGGTGPGLWCRPPRRCQGRLPPAAVHSVPRHLTPAAKNTSAKVIGEVQKMKGLVVCGGFSYYCVILFHLRKPGQELVRIFEKM